MSVFDFLISETNLPAPVLAEPSSLADNGGEARESTQQADSESLLDSRGGQLIYDGTTTMEAKASGQNDGVKPKMESGESAEAQGSGQQLSQQIPEKEGGAIKSASRVTGGPSDKEAVRGVRESKGAGASRELQPTISDNVALPSVSHEATSLASTLDKIAAFFRRYVIFPIPEQYDLIALWVAHTWVYDVFHWSPYLIVRSPEAECGKTTVLSSLKLLTRAPWQVVVPTPAVIYRKIEAHRPTLLLDEYDAIYSDKIKSEANEILRGTLNAGFERGVVIPRCDGPKNELLEFSPYCPKALAGIGRLPETVESRAFIIPIVRLGQEEKVEEYDEEIAPEEARPIAEALKVWAGVARSHLKGANPTRPAELKPRQRNIAKPLLAIADLAGGEWPEKARDALVKVCAKEKLISQGQQLLADVRKIMLAGSMDKITTDMLLEYLVRVENANSPWPVMWENDLRLGKIRGPAKKLASLLKNFDIHPHTIRFGSDVKNGYMRIDFLEAWDRYLEPAKAETAELDLDI